MNKLYFLIWGFALFHNYRPGCCMGITISASTWGPTRDVDDEELAGIVTVGRSVPFRPLSTFPGGVVTALHPVTSDRADQNGHMVTTGLAFNNFKYGSDEGDEVVVLSGKRFCNLQIVNPRIIFDACRGWNYPSNFVRAVTDWEGGFNCGCRIFMKTGQGVTIGHELIKLQVSYSVHSFHCNAIHDNPDAETAFTKGL